MFTGYNTLHSWLESMCKDEGFQVIWNLHTVSKANMSLNPPPPGVHRIQRHFLLVSGACVKSTKSTVYLHLLLFTYILLKQNISTSSYVVINCNRATIG
jgi:hypothetical protein